MRRTFMALAIAGFPTVAAANGDGLASCGAEGFEALIGQPVGSVDVDWPEKTRIVRPGDAVTADYLPDRLTVELDEDDRITALRCG